MARLPPSAPALLVLIAVGLVLAAPLLQGETLCTDDGALHIYRTVALDRALRDGLLYPRWFPDLAYGYGFPFFVYREPLSYYALEALHLLGLSVPTAFNVTMAGGVVVAGIAIYLLGRDIFGPRGGMLAGVVHMAAPYVLIGPLVRGNLPEVIAFALMPLILFFFRRLIVYGHTRYFVASTASYAALFLTHNISSLLFTPFLLVYIALLGWVQVADSRWQMADGRSPIADSPASPRDRSSIISHVRYAIRDTRYALLSIALTLGLTAFFWLPALAEQNEAQLYLTHSTRGNDYHFNFISLEELLGGPGSFDPNLLNPPLRISFGWAQLVLAALGVLGYRRAQNREQRATVIAAAVAAITFTLMALPITLPLWERLPLIRFVQFPWRFVGRAMLPTALLAAASLSPPRSINHKDTKTRSQLRVFAPLRLRSGQASWLVVTVFGTVVLVALLFTAPLSYPRVCPTPHALDINDVFAYERLSGHVGVDPLGAYLPVTVIERPGGSPLEAMYSAGRAIERFDASALPGGARVFDAQYGPNRADVLVSSPTAFTATYLAFAFPGWNAQIDGHPIAIRPSYPNGLVTFDVPAGEHRIHVEFGDSPQRALADGISLIAVVAMIAAVVIHWRSRRSLIAYRLLLIASGARHASRFTLSILLALLVYVVVKSLLIDPGLTPLRATRLIGDALNGIAHPPDATFGDELRLLGYTATPSTVRPGERFRVDLYWKALKPLTANYQAEVSIADTDGWLWSPKHADRPRDYNSFPSMPEWPLDGYAVDSFEVEVLPGAPPGEYDLVVQVFDRETLAPLLPGTLPAPGRVAASIGKIRVDRATRSFDADELRIYGGERHELDDDMTLLGYNIDRVEGVPGESILLTFFWQADRKPQTDRSFRIELVDSSGNVLSSSVLPVGNESYRTSHWEAGEQVITLASLRVPAAAPSGDYHWRAVLLDDAARPAYDVELQPTLRVTAPARTFDVPPIENRIDVGVGDFATLLGFNVAGDAFAPGDTIDLTLFWQPRAETSTSYKVFVHVLDEAGHIVAQADAVPVNGERPTTGWLPHEVIPDRHTIPLPGDLVGGLYRIQAGLYDVDGGARLKTSEGADSIILADIDVKE
ncbi:MAG TPA: 6-pyruvoyl-tetrahydropterin synthase-related protein [Anaerolineae bacterium]|nr:6-pyruvoyl-tetrahydropterin synthase-related protein [Anaerolineae bacterium]